MGDRNIRKMSKRERRRRSLASKTVRSTVMSCILFGVIALVIGLGLYGSALIQQSISRAYETAKSASVSAKRGADSVTLAKEVMNVYQSLTPEQREQNRTEEYRQYFSGIEAVEQTGGAHDTLQHMLRNFVIDVDYVYLVMYDRDTCAMVYLVDSDQNDPFYPGEWEPVSEKDVKKFLDWDGEGILYEIEKTEEYGWLCTAGYPMQDENGETYAFLLVDITVNSVAERLKYYALQIGIALAAATILIAWLMTRRVKKTVAEPINAIASAAAAYAGDKRNGTENTDHFSHLDIRTGDELENLSLTMADMEKSLAEHEEEIVRISAEKERIGTELNMAARIQAAMLPHIFPPFPNRKEFDLYASMNPAKEVGGDFYDYFLTDDDHLCMVMADVSGKGIPAALFMMASKIILQSVAMLGRSAGEILTKTNEAICSNNQAEMFVTVWVGILEISTGKLTAANAGHEYPAMMRAGGDFELFKDKHGFVIGYLAGLQYKEYELQLNPGDKLFLYTDGVPEAMDRQEEMFGTDRMTAALNSGKNGTPEQVLREVRRAVDCFVQDAEQFDDLTMLCLEYKGTVPGGKTMTTDAKTENIEAITEFVSRELEARECPHREQMQICVAIDEIVSNIALYAYTPGTGKVTVNFAYEEQERTVVLTFIDEGIPYDPLQREDPDVSLPAEKREIGGLGIYLVRKTMDGMSYCREDGKNILTVRKKICISAVDRQDCL